MDSPEKALFPRLIKLDERFVGCRKGISALLIASGITACGLGPASAGKDFCCLD